MKIFEIKYIIHKLFSPSNTLGGKAVKGGIWVFSLQIFNRLFVLIRNIILARLLSPDDFGLFGIALLSLVTVDTLTEVGIRHALIQKKGEIKPFLNTAWTIQVIRVFVLSAILFFSSSYIANFFNEPQAVTILKAISIALLLRGFYNIKVVYFEKELIFQKFFKFQFSGVIFDLLVSVTTAIIFQNAWALIYGLIAGNLARLIVSYLIDPYRPTFTVNIGYAKEMFSFGKWILISSVFVFLLTQGDSIFIGKVLGVTALGFYQLAYRISNMSVTEVTHVVQQVSFPLFSKLQENIIKLKTSYLNILHLITTLSFFIAGLMFILAQDFTIIFLGEKWLPMVPAMKVLIWWGVTASIAASITPLFQAIGKPQIITKLQIVQVLLVIILIYPLTIRYNIMGTALAILIASLCLLFVKTSYLIKSIQCKNISFYKHIIAPLSFILISGAGSYLIRMIIPHINIFTLLMHFVIFTVLYILLNLIADKYFKYSIKDILREGLRMINN